MSVEFLRRKDAGAYLTQKYGFGAAGTLCKLACTGGGPIYHLAGRTPLYKPADLDAWATERIGGAKRHTSEYRDPTMKPKGRAPKRIDATVAESASA